MSGGVKRWASRQRQADRRVVVSRAARPNNFDEVKSEYITTNAGRAVSRWKEVVPRIILPCGASFSYDFTQKSQKNPLRQQTTRFFSVLLFEAPLPTPDTRVPFQSCENFIAFFRFYSPRPVQQNRDIQEPISGEQGDAHPHFSLNVFLITTASGYLSGLHPTTTACVKISAVFHTLGPSKQP